MANFSEEQNRLLDAIRKMEADGVPEDKIRQVVEYAKQKNPSLVGGKAKQQPAFSLAPPPEPKMKGALGAIEAQGIEVPTKPSGETMPDIGKEESRLGFMGRGLKDMFETASYGVDILGSYLPGTIDKRDIAGLQTKEVQEQKRIDYPKLSQKKGTDVFRDASDLDAWTVAASDILPTAVAMVSAPITGGTSAMALTGTYFGSSVADNYEMGRELGLSENQSSLYGTVMGSIEAAAENLGLDALTKIPKSWLSKTVKESVKKYGKEGAEKTLGESMKAITAWLAKRGIGAAQGSAVGFLEESATSLGQSGTQLAFDAATGSKLFDPNKEVPQGGVVGEVFSRALEAGAGGVLGEGIIGGVRGIETRDNKTPAPAQPTAPPASPDAQIDEADLEALSEPPVPPVAPPNEIAAKKADIERRRREELSNVGIKQKERAFSKLRDEKDEDGKVTKVRTPEEKLNAINLIERNVAEGSILTKEEQKELQKTKDELASQGYEVPKILGQKYNEGMKVIVSSSILDESLAEGEEIITKVLTPQINKDGKMVQTAQIEVTVGTKKGGLTREQWLEEQKKKERKVDKINAKYDAERSALQKSILTDPTAPPIDPTAPVEPVSEPVDPNTSEGAATLSSEAMLEMVDALDEDLNALAEGNPTDVAAQDEVSKVDKILQGYREMGDFDEEQLGLMRPYFEEIMSLDDELSSISSKEAKDSLGILKKKHGERRKEIAKRRKEIDKAISDIAEGNFARASAAAVVEEDLPELMADLDDVGMPVVAAEPEPVMEEDVTEEVVTPTEVATQEEVVEPTEIAAQEKPTIPTVKTTPKEEKPVKQTNKKDETESVLEGLPSRRDESEGGQESPELRTQEAKQEEVVPPLSEQGKADVGGSNTPTVSEKDVQEYLDTANYNKRSDKNVLVRLPIDLILKNQQLDFAVERGNNNEIKGRIDRAKSFIEKRNNDLEASDIYIPPKGRNAGKIGFSDGRHRIIAAKELGAKNVFVEIPRTPEQFEQLWRLLSDFGNVDGIQYTELTSIGGYGDYQIIQTSDNTFLLKEDRSNDLYEFKLSESGSVSDGILFKNGKKIKSDSRIEDAIQEHLLENNPDSNTRNVNRFIGRDINKPIPTLIDDVVTVSDFKAISAKGEKGRKARAELTKRLGKDTVNDMTRITANFESIINNLENQGKIRKECP